MAHYRRQWINITVTPCKFSHRMTHSGHCCHELFYPAAFSIYWLSPFYNTNTHTHPQCTCILSAGQNEHFIAPVYIVTIYRTSCFTGTQMVSQLCNPWTDKYWRTISRFLLCSRGSINRPMGQTPSLSSSPSLLRFPALVPFHSPPNPWGSLQPLPKCT